MNQITDQIFRWLFWLQHIDNFYYIDVGFAFACRFISSPSASFFSWQFKDGLFDKWGLNSGECWSFWLLMSFRGEGWIEQHRSYVLYLFSTL